MSGIQYVLALAWSLCKFQAFGHSFRIRRYYSGLCDFPHWRLTMSATSVINDIVGEIGAGDHLILFYDTPENKRRVLFDFLQAGLKEGSRGVYISTEESPEQGRM